MRALCQTESGIQLRDIEVPEPGPGEALVQIAFAGICSTDLEIARGYMGFRGVLGHEFVGVVVAAPEPALQGTRVVGEINLNCGRCALCARGLGRHCPNRSVLGIAGKDGCFAEYITLPLGNLHRVPDGLCDRAACFTEPIAACFEILEQLTLTKDHRIAVLGDGKLGLLVAMVLATRGIDPVLAGKHERKLALARARGLRTAHPAELEAKSFDFVIEATGSPSGMQRAVELVRPRGSVVLKSTYHGPLTLDAAPIVIDEITIVGSRCGPFPPALEGLEARRLEPQLLIDEEFALADAERALQRAAEPGVLKVLLQMR
jgi:2-desacetyl-2-hydroxyethyl bacteriochlorophyllide A dehydrogenase